MDWTGNLTTKILYTGVSSFLVPLPLSHGLHGTLGIGKGKPFEAHMLWTGLNAVQAQETGHHLNI